MNIVRIYASKCEILFNAQRFWHVGVFLCLIDFDVIAPQVFMRKRSII